MITHLIDQPFGIGDIMFISPIIKIMAECYSSDHFIWPVDPLYVWMKNYIVFPPNVEMVSTKSEVTNVNHKIPFQHATSYSQGHRDCMEAKYMMMSIPLEVWRTLTIRRNYERENKLEHFLISNDLLPHSAPYVFINNYFAHPDHNYSTEIRVDSPHKKVYQNYIEGYNLMDWCGIIERADEIHTVSTATFFIVEAICPNHPKLHLYPRKPLDKDLSPIISLLHNKWIQHE